MKVYELIQELEDMPQDFDVAMWIGNRWDNNERRVDIIEVRNVGDIVDLYYEEDNDDS